MRPYTGKNIDKADMLGGQASSFLHRHSVKAVLIEPHDSLWRFVSKKHSNKFSDYWIDHETMNSIMSIFRSWNDYSQHTKKEVVKDNLAILENWGSNLGWRVKITFRKPVIAYTGQTGPQKFFPENNPSAIQPLFGSQATKSIEHRLGGFQQYVIPRFKGINDATAAAFANVTYFQHI